MAHNVSIRRATPEELEDFRARLGGNRRAATGCIAGCATLGGVMVAFWTAVAGASAEVVSGVGLGVCLLLLGVWGKAVWGRGAKQTRERENADLAGEEVEVLEVTQATAMRLLEDHSSVTPGFAFDIGDGKLLVLKGPFLMEPALFGSKRKAQRFPCSDFTLSRWPHSGEVLRIEVQGRKSRPLENRSTVALTTLPRMPSMVIDGGLKEIDRALMRVQAQ